jgi:hypothetical protein
MKKYDRMELQNKSQFILKNNIAINETYLKAVRLRYIQRCGDISVRPRCKQFTLS